MKLYDRYVAALTKLQDVFLLAIRLYWGYRFFRTGLGKFQNFDQTVSFFTSLNIPMPEVNAVMAASTELLGGLCLLLGLASRLATIPLIFTMIVAYATAHREALVNILNDPAAFTKQEPFLFLLTCVVVLLFGAGRFSVDALIRRRAKA